MLTVDSVLTERVISFLLSCNALIDADVLSGLNWDKLTCEELLNIFLCLFLPLWLSNLYCIIHTLSLESLVKLSFAYAIQFTYGRGASQVYISIFWSMYFKESILSCNSASLLLTKRKLQNLGIILNYEKKIIQLLRVILILFIWIALTKVISSSN